MMSRQTTCITHNCSFRSLLGPGPVDRLRLEPQRDHRQIRLAFLAPMWPNGVLEGYQVGFIGKRNVRFLHWY